MLNENVRTLSAGVTAEATLLDNAAVRRSHRPLDLLSCVPSAPAGTHHADDLSLDPIPVIDFPKLPNVRNRSNTAYTPPHFLDKAIAIPSSSTFSQEDPAHADAHASQEAEQPVRARQATSATPPHRRIPIIKVHPASTILGAESSTISESSVAEGMIFDDMAHNSSMSRASGAAVLQPFTAPLSAFLTVQSSRSAPHGDDADLADVVDLQCRIDMLDMRNASLEQERVRVVARTQHLEEEWKRVEERNRHLEGETKRVDARSQHLEEEQSKIVLVKQRLDKERKKVDSENAQLKRDILEVKQSYSQLEKRSEQNALAAEREYLALKEELAASRSETSELADDIASMKVQNARLKEGLWVLTSKILALNVEIAVTRNDNTALHNELSDMQFENSLLKQGAFEREAKRLEAGQKLDCLVTENEELRKEVGRCERVHQKAKKKGARFKKMWAKSEDERKKLQRSNITLKRAKQQLAVARDEFQQRKPLCLAAYVAT